jgi:hypothetical protein
MTYRATADEVLTDGDLDGVAHRDLNLTAPVLGPGAIVLAGEHTFPCESTSGWRTQPTPCAVPVARLGTREPPPSLASQGHAGRACVTTRTQR